LYGAFAWARRARSGHNRRVLAARAVVRLLLDGGADPSLGTSDRGTPLMVAAAVCRAA
jgi:hypothetical protein